MKITPDDNRKKGMNARRSLLYSLIVKDSPQGVQNLGSFNSVIKGVRISKLWIYWVIWRFQINEWEWNVYLTCQQSLWIVISVNNSETRILTRSAHWNSPSFILSLIAKPRHQIQDINARHFEQKTEWTEKEIWIKLP